LVVKKLRKMQEGEAVSGGKDVFDKCLRFYTQKVEEQGEDGELNE